MSLSVRLEESCFKDAEWIYHYVFIMRNVTLKLRNVYVITCSSGGKLFLKLQNLYIITCLSGGKLF